MDGKQIIEKCKGLKIGEEVIVFDGGNRHKDHTEPGLFL
jgi:hypothetical protein